MLKLTLSNAALVIFLFLWSLEGVISPCTSSVIRFLAVLLSVRRGSKALLDLIEAVELRNDLWW